MMNIKKLLNKNLKLCKNYPVLILSDQKSLFMMKLKKQSSLFKNFLKEKHYHVI